MNTDKRNHRAYDVPGEYSHTGAGFDAAIFPDHDGPDSSFSDIHIPGTGWRAVCRGAQDIRGKKHLS